MSAETGSIGMEAMSFSAAPVEALVSPAEITTNITSTPLIDISNQIHPYTGVTPEPASLINQGSFEDFPRAFEVFSDEKSVFPAETFPIIDTSAPVSPFLDQGQKSFETEGLSTQTEIPSVFYEAFAEPAFNSMAEIIPNKAAISTEIQDALFEPHFDIPLFSDSHPEIEISQSITEPASEMVIDAPSVIEVLFSADIPQSAPNLTFGATSEIQTETQAQTQPAVSGFAETQTQTETEIEAELQIAPATKTNIGSRVGASTPYLQTHDEITPPPTSNDLYVIDEAANSERLSRTEDAIDKVFQDEEGEVVGTQVTSILGDTPELDEISDIVKDQTQTIEDGSYKEYIDDFAEERFESKDEAKVKAKKLLRKKTAVMVSTHGVPVQDEDVERVVRKGKPKRESVIFKGK